MWSLGNLCWGNSCYDPAFTQIGSKLGSMPTKARVCTPYISTNPGRGRDDYLWRELTLVTIAQPLGTEYRTLTIITLYSLGEDFTSPALLQWDSSANKRNNLRVELGLMPVSLPVKALLLFSSGLLPDNLQETLQPLLLGESLKMTSAQFCTWHLLAKRRSATNKL